MPRWEPDARERFVSAALHLFLEQGYDETTVAQIADRAGLTRSTFFRHFSDKREVLSAGQETLAALFAEGIAKAPADATPLEAIDSGLTTAAEAMTPFNREIGGKMEAVIAASTELQQRAVLKQVGLAAAMTEALKARGVESPVADTAAEFGVLAFKEAYAAWSGGADEELATLTSRALDRLRSTLTQLG